MNEFWPLPILSPTPPPLVLLLKHSARLYSTKPWRYSSRVAFYEAIYRRLRLANLANKSLSRYPLMRHFETLSLRHPKIECPATAILRAHSCLGAMLTRSRWVKPTQYIVRVEACDEALAKLDQITQLHSGMSEDHYVLVAHLFAAGIRASIIMALESPWREFSLPYNGQ